MKKVKMIICIAEIILAACIGFIAGQSTSLSLTPSIQQTVPVVNQTATVNVSMTATSNFSIIQHQTSSVNPSSANTISNVGSSVISTSPSTTT
ncbi:uncharacterized protein LOC144641073, partial [Oculina patagonica]